MYLLEFSGNNLRCYRRCSDHRHCQPVIPRRQQGLQLSAVFSLRHNKRPLCFPPTHLLPPLSLLPLPRYRFHSTRCFYRKRFHRKRRHCHNDNIHAVHCRRFSGRPRIDRHYDLSKALQFTFQESGWIVVLHCALLFQRSHCF